MGGWRPGYSNGIRYYDTVYFAKRIKCPVEMLAGLGDYTCPPSGITVLYYNFTSEKKITWWQNRTHSYTPKDAVTTVLSEAAK